MIQLFASDMDGTLLQDHLTIHPENVQAIHELQKNGYHFVICTGRDLLQAQLCLKPAAITCPVIALNGSKAYDEEGNTLFEVTIPHNEARQLIDQLEKAGLKWQVMTSKGIFEPNFEQDFLKRIEALQQQHPHLSKTEFEIEVAKLRALFHAKEVASFDEVISDPTIAIYKISSNHEDGGEVYDSIKTYIHQNLPSLVVTSSYHTNIEVNHREAQKGIALKRFAKKLGLSMEEVFAIGDNSNDVSMLQMAGYGVAMENANQAAKNAARYFTTSNLDGGVAKAIRTCLATQSKS